MRLTWMVGVVALGWPAGHYGWPLERSAAPPPWLEATKYKVIDEVPRHWNVRKTNVSEPSHFHLGPGVPDQFSRVVTTCSTCPKPGTDGGLTVTGADLDGGGAAGSRDQCAVICTNSTACVAFSWALRGATPCRLHRYSELYTVVATNDTEYWLRKSPTSTKPSRLAVPYVVDVPTRGVSLGEGTVFARSVELCIDYLLRVYSVDEMLWWFRHRAGDPSPPGTPTGWDRCDHNLRNGSAMCLKGTVASAFLMGAGGILRWREHPTLRQRFNKVIDGIRDAVASDGFAAAFAPNEIMYRENPSYVTSWLVHGLLEADVAVPAGSLPPRPIDVARGMVDWYSAQQTNPRLPEFLPADRTTSNIPSMFGNTTGHQIYLISQGIIHHTRMATSVRGRMRDVELVQTLYEEDEWLAQLSTKNPNGIWLKRWFPHNYEVTAFEAYLDMYSLTGESKYHDAMVGAWEMFRENWIHLGGSMAINEGSDGLDTSKGLWYPPKSYYLEGDPHDVGPAGGRHVTGETCGSVFWIKFNQRFHRLNPTSEQYTAEIERSLLNIGIANQAPSVGSPQTGIRYFALLHGHKEAMTNISTCCEGQGTRLHGSLPEYIFSIPPAGTTEFSVFVNLYVSSSITILHPTVHTNMTFQISSDFPAIEQASKPTTVTVTHGASLVVLATLHLRIPRWAGPGSVVVGLNLQNHNESYALATPGSYLRIERRWTSGDSVSVGLRMKLTSTRYIGLNQVNGSTRFGFEFGPTLLAAVPSSASLWNSATNCLHLPHDPEQPVEWLQPVVGTPLHFSVRLGAGTVEFMPYYEVNDQLMTVFPCFPPVVVA